MGGIRIYSRYRVVYAHTYVVNSCHPVPVRYKIASSFPFHTIPHPVDNFRTSKKSIEIKRWNPPSPLPKEVGMLVVFSLLC